MQEEFGQMTLTEHLRELRSCLLISLAAVCAGLAAASCVIEQLAGWFLRPLVQVLPQGVSLIFTSYQEGFFFILNCRWPAAWLLPARSFFPRYGVLSLRGCIAMKSGCSSLLPPFPPSASPGARFSVILCCFRRFSGFLSAIPMPLSRPCPRWANIFPWPCACFLPLA